MAFLELIFVKFALRKYHGYHYHTTVDAVDMTGCSGVLITNKNKKARCKCITKGNYILRVSVVTSLGLQKIKGFILCGKVNLFPMQPGRAARACVFLGKIPTSPALWKEQVLAGGV